MRNVRKVVNNRLSSSGVAALPPFALEPDAGERLVFGEVTILVRASADATGGSFSLFEEVPPMVDTPRHVHEREDEVFYPLEGEHVIEVGDEEFTVGPGGVVFAPRRVPHAQRRVVPGEGRLLVLTAPGGFDGFFRELAAAQDAGTLGPDAYAAASERYGITWL
jgi:mannose-6-phosphate isomerase-like protein (cupin superfamily)